MDLSAHTRFPVALLRPLGHLSKPGQGIATGASVGGQMATFVFFPEGAYGPTNNCVGIGDVLRRRGHRVVFIVEESFAGTLEAKGFEERLMRLTPPPETEEDAGAVLEGLHPRHRAGLPQADDRAARAGSSRRPSRRWSTAPGTSTSRLREIIDELAARRDRRGQRRRVPGAAGQRAAVGADRLLQPGRDQGPRGAAAVLRLPDRRRARVGRRTARSTRARTGDAARVVQTSSAASAARRRCPSCEFIHESPTGSTSTSIPTRSTTRARGRSGRRWHNLESACARPTTPGSCPSALPAGEGPLVYLSLGSLGSADVELMRG